MLPADSACLLSEQGSVRLIRVFSPFLLSCWQTAPQQRLSLGNKFLVIMKNPFLGLFCPAMHIIYNNNTLWGRNKRCYQLLIACGTHQDVQRWHHLIRHGGFPPKFYLSGCTAFLKEHLER